MKILLSAVGIIAIVGLSLALCSSPAPSHGGGARIAIYNLSSTVRLLERSVEDMSRQLTRIEGRLQFCEQEKKR